MIFLASLRLDRLAEELPAPNDDFVVCFVPTAAIGESEGPWPWVEADRKFFAQAGYKITDLELSASSPEAVGEALTRCSHVHVTGGNTFYLLQEMQRVHFREQLAAFLDRGGSFSGGSAGAIVMGSDINWVSHVESRYCAPRLTSTEGLGFTIYDPVVHWTTDLVDHRDAIFEELLAAKRHPVALTDDEAIVLKDSGPWLVHVSGETRAL